MHTNNSLSMMEGKVGPSNCESKTLDDAVEKLLQGKRIIQYLVQ